MVLYTQAIVGGVVVLVVFPREECVSKQERLLVQVQKAQSSSGNRVADDGRCECGSWQVRRTLIAGADVVNKSLAK